MEIPKEAPKDSPRFCNWQGVRLNPDTRKYSCSTYSLESCPYDIVDVRIGERFGKQDQLFIWDAKISFLPKG